MDKAIEMIEITNETAEDLEMSAWPGIAMVMRQGWLIRLSGGFTSRANSATAVVPGADWDGAGLDWLEAVFAGRGLPAVIRLGARSAVGLPDRLAARGYGLKTPSDRLRLDLTSSRAPRANSDVEINPSRPAGWVEAFGRDNGRSDFDAATMATLLDLIVPKTLFASLWVEGERRAVGRA